MSDGWSRVALETIAQLVAARTGLVTTRTPEDFERASVRAMERLAIENWGEFAGKLAAGVGWDALLDEITIGETYFFRNREHFDLVRDTIVPAILRERPTDHGLRVWSAGCASGEETYSLAILLDQLGLLANARVLGTDISNQAIAKARACCYREWAFREIDTASSDRYFEGERNERRVVSEIREQVLFSQVNLADKVYPSSSNDTENNDLIFCRNVLIYLSREAIERVGRQFFASLAPGGWLVTGPSDPLLSHAAPFEVITNPRGICYRRPSQTKSARWSHPPRANDRIELVRPSGPIADQPITLPPVAATVPRPLSDAALTV
ncbi:MAG TPA: protein-glutamate O-methyltransferase CheR, partial [Polyangiales bacterium]|nr:protein-glutamate O-methyltransferase CheR [Polyangiales bacterium]